MHHPFRAAGRSLGLQRRSDEPDRGHARRGAAPQAGARSREPQAYSHRSKNRLSSGAVSATKAEVLRRLHVEGPMLVLPNAWDAGSARIFVEKRASPPSRRRARGSRSVWATEKASVSVATKCSPPLLASPAAFPFPSPPIWKQATGPRRRPSPGRFVAPPTPAPPPRLSRHGWRG